jgi:MEMO1 family protein
MQIPRRERPPAVAGTFYPAEAEELRALVRDCLATALPTDGSVPKAVIAPHAGYVYSGPVAGFSFRACAAGRGQFRRVVLMGPAHYVSLEGIATSGASAFRTPLGSVPVDRETTARLEQLDGVAAHDRVHAPEHSLEVELPFLQEILGEFSIVPLLAGNVNPETVAAVLDAAWIGAETLVVISSDLSHYHDYPSARERDSETAATILALDDAGLRTDQACGCRPIQGLLRCARQHRLRARQLDLRNSGDTAGPRDRVVGYGAFAFDATPEPAP